jgi:hypothetical protein
MGSLSKPNECCHTGPASSSHITPKLKVAKLQHHKGFHIIFVESRGPSSLDGMPDFQFETTPDGLPLIDADVTLDSSFMGHSISNS